jgi:arginyl-tRNA synthetase
MREAAERRAPHRVATYALELGQAFAAFYRDAPVLNAEDDALRTFRLQLCVVSQRTLARALALLGVSAPEQM